MKMLFHSYKKYKLQQRWLIIIFIKHNPSNWSWLIARTHTSILFGMFDKFLNSMALRLLSIMLKRGTRERRSIRVTAMINGIVDDTISCLQYDRS